jgi:transposase
MSGQVFVFRGRRGDLIKVLWFDGDGLCVFSKRLERGRFVWPQATSGTVALTRAQLSMLLEGIDWRRPQRTWDPQYARWPDSGFRLDAFTVTLPHLFLVGKAEPSLPD